MRIDDPDRLLLGIAGGMGKKFPGKRGLLLRKIAYNKGRGGCCAAGRATKNDGRPHGTCALLCYAPFVTHLGWQVTQL